MAEDGENSKKKESNENQREAKDRKFKDMVNLADFNKNKVELIDSYYSPDVFFDKTDDKEKTIVIMESSSTGDRKVHIGELNQFLSYCSQNKEYDKYYFVLYLCGKGDSAPEAPNEKTRLQYYYNSFPLSKTQRDKIKKIAILKQPNDEDLEALTIETVDDYDGLAL